MKKPRYFLIVTLIVIFQISIQAGTTGKISGTVIDSENGNPLPGANVFIEGTTLGAATDAEGYYYIINIPPGSWSIQVTMMGYGLVRETQVKVVTDMTSKVHFALLPTVLQGEGVTVVSVR
ncbi:MAG: carboxypeptidase-like regulatory domain-containing protein, partial [Candidatus Marinimicrobia bacterium]|nr:carboxypeptidase-like regulatory domain-containing protein [Candidatus Neomarinimicrobiota bacterium]